MNEAFKILQKVQLTVGDGRIAASHPQSLCLCVSLFIAPAPTCPRPPPPTPPLTPPRPPAPPLTTVWTSALRPRPAAVPDQNLPQPLTTNAPRPWPRCLCTTARWRTRASSGWAWTWVTTTATCTRASWWVYTQNIISYMQNFYLTEEDKNYFTEIQLHPLHLSQLQH